MAVIPVARMLFELGSSPVTAPVRGEAAVVARRCNSCRSEEEVRAEVEHARVRGVEEGFERGRVEGMRLESELHSKLADEQNARLSALSLEAMGRIDAGLERARADISKVAAQTLAVFFQGKIEIEAIGALSNDLSNMISEKVPSRVILRGPRPWIDQLVSLPEIASRSVDVELHESDAIDVSITIDGTILETTIGAWLAGLRSVL